MEEARNKFGIQFCVSSIDRWVDQSGQQEFRGYIEKPGDRASQQLGSDISTGRVCVQRFGESEYMEEPISDFVWDTTKRSF
jgi:hypothetical protein